MRTSAVGRLCKPAPSVSEMEAMRVCPGGGGSTRMRLPRPQGTQCKTRRQTRQRWAQQGKRPDLIIAATPCLVRACRWLACWPRLFAWKDSTARGLQRLMAEGTWPRGQRLGPL